MRPEISDKNMERLREWARTHSIKYAWFRTKDLGTRGGHPVYTVDDALNDLLEMEGF